MPVLGRRPYVGFSPKIPQKEAGTLMEPFVSEPYEIGAMPAEVADALPDEDPPLI